MERVEQPGLEAPRPFGQSASTDVAGICSKAGVHRICRQSTGTPRWSKYFTQPGEHGCQSLARVEHIEFRASTSHRLGRKAASSAKGNARPSTKTNSGDQRVTRAERWNEHGWTLGAASRWTWVRSWNAKLARTSSNHPGNPRERPSQKTWMRCLEMDFATASDGAWHLSSLTRFTATIAAALGDKRSGRLRRLQALLCPHAHGVGVCGEGRRDLTLGRPRGRRSGLGANRVFPPRSSPFQRHDRSAGKEREGRQGVSQARMAVKAAAQQEKSSAETGKTMLGAS